MPLSYSQRTAGDPDAAGHSRHILPSILALALSAVLVLALTAPSLAADAPELPRIVVSGPETLAQGNEAIFLVTCPTELTLRASIVTEGLEFVSVTGDTSSKDAVILPAGEQEGMVAFTYMVTGEAGTPGSFHVENAVATDAAGEEIKLDAVVWSGTIGENGHEPLPEPDAVTFGPESAVQGEPLAVMVSIPSRDYGISAQIRTGGVELIDCIGAVPSDRGRFDLTEEQSCAVLLYRITGEPGTQAFVDVEDVHILQNGTDRMGTSSGWTCKISEPEAPVAEPSSFTWAEALSMYPDATQMTQEVDLTDTINLSVGQVQLLSQENEAVLLVPFDPDGAYIPSGNAAAARVCTGEHAIMLDGSDGNVVGLGALVVRGDVLGNGELSLTQLVRLAQAYQGTNPLSGLYEQAADTNQSGALDLGDLVMLAQWLRSASAEPSGVAA